MAEDTTHTKPNKIGDNRRKDGKFGPGNIANPNGRPKGSVSVVEAIRRKLEECPDGDEKTYLQLLTQKVFDKALDDGDVQIIKDIINRVDGMPTQSTDITSKGEKIETNTIVFTDFKDNTSQHDTKSQ